MLRAVLFDLDGTLFDRESAVRALLHEQRQAWARELASVPASVFVERALALDDHGHGPKPAVYRQLAAEFGLPDETAAALATDFWARYPFHARLFEGVLPLLRALRARGLRLGLVTNGAAAMQETVATRLGLAPFMDAVLISEREGVRKPAPEIFARALAALGVHAAEAWFVGDHPQADAEGAAGAGLTSIWLRTGHWPPPRCPHHKIAAVRELLPLVDAAITRARGSI